MNSVSRVVITGLGAVNSVAGNGAEFAQALRQGKCGIGPLFVFDPEGHMTSNAAQVRDLDPVGVRGYGFSGKRASRADILAFHAAGQAMSQAGLMPPPPETAREMGVVVGGGAGGLLEAEEFYQSYLKKDKTRLRFSKLAAAYCSSTADRISAVFGTMGPKTTFMTACSSGATAIGYSRDLIAGGMAEVVLAGGTEPMSRITYTAFNALRAVDPEYCRPFDKNRAGLTLGEGAAFMVLESLARAQKRGADILAEVLGYGLSGDAHHMTAPHPQGLGAALAMRSALSDAGLMPGQIDYINAHGTATPANDPVETKAIKEVFGRAAYDIPVSSTKSMIGHTLGAAGALEAAAVVLAIGGDFIPPTIHHQEPDPDCDLDYVAKGAREARINLALSNSFAFGGNNTSLILARYTEKGAANE